MEAIFTVAVVELVRLTILALFLERALALVFESKPWVRRLDGRGLSPCVAFGVALSVCVTWDLDSVSAIAAAGPASTAIRPYKLGGAILTAMILAGGSKLVMSMWATVARLRRDGPG